ncbi:hypothetical protein L0152_01570, partial [bacterium]|nr:hypothetical protein [bacterium]
FANEDFVLSANTGFLSPRRNKYRSEESHLLLMKNHATSMSNANVTSMFFQSLLVIKIIRAPLI